MSDEPRNDHRLEVPMDDDLTNARGFTFCEMAGNHPIGHVAGGRCGRCGDTGIQSRKPFIIRNGVRPPICPECLNNATSIVSVLDPRNMSNDKDGHKCSACGCVWIEECVIREDRVKDA